MKEIKTNVIYIMPFLLIHFLYPQESNTITDSLMTQFIKAWNNEDIPEMTSMMEPTAFFKSPYQLRYTADTMAVTVLVTNPPIYKVVEWDELYSNIDENIAWSIGRLVSDVYENGIKTDDEQLKSDYIFVFVRKDNGPWKIQMLLFYD